MWLSGGPPRHHRTAVGHWGMDDETRLHRWSQQQPVPWRNGGGLTREIASSPPGAGPADFVWRVSIADVDQPGPFSTFPGVDRVITLLEGESMVLDLPGAQQVLLPHEPFAFAGELPVMCHLPGGSTRDLNLMTRRGQAWAEVQVLQAEPPVRLPAADAGQLLVVLGDGLQVAGATGDWTLERYDVLQTREPVTIRGGAFAHLRIW